MWRSSIVSKEKVAHAKIRTAAIGLLFVILPWSLVRWIQVCAIPTSHMLDVPYYPQEDRYYCTAACVQMAIEYVSELEVQQNSLAMDMGTDPKKNGTDPDRMPIPFQIRGYSNVSYKHNQNPDTLKEQISQCSIAILTIWFDVDHNSSHSVVAVGYDAQGIFVHDPWRTDWDQPACRRTGQNAFIPNNLLSNLWSQRGGEMLEIPIRVHFYTTWVYVKNMPPSSVSMVRIDGREQSHIGIGEIRPFRFDMWSRHRIQVDQYVSGSEGTRYFCADNSRTVSSRGRFAFEYLPQYYLNVSSRFGTVSGSSWYDNGSVAAFSVTPTEIGMPDLIGFLGGRYVFDHWNTDDTTPSARVRMYSPLRVVAIWREEPTAVWLLAIVAVGFIILVYRYRKIKQDP